jgi:fructose-1,6-bisphosphatase/inositol monophosphatase family enzyme
MTFDDADLDWLGDLLAETAAAEIMPRFRRLGAGDIRRKTSAADLVTEADEHAERVITQAVGQRYPGALVLGEEACSANPGLLAGWSGADLAFVIDPVDGTYNFASGVPLFGVMLAVVAAGETVAGIIHDPVGGDWCRYRI